MLRHFRCCQIRRDALRCRYVMLLLMLLLRAGALAVDAASARRAHAFSPCCRHMLQRRCFRVDVYDMFFAMPDFHAAMPLFTLLLPRLRLMPPLLIRCRCLRQISLDFHFFALIYRGVRHHRHREYFITYVRRIMAKHTIP